MLRCLWVCVFVSLDNVCRARVNPVLRLSYLLYGGPLRCPRPDYACVFVRGQRPQNLSKNQKMKFCAKTTIFISRGQSRFRTRFRSEFSTGSISDFFLCLSTPSVLLRSKYKCKTGGEGICSLSKKPSSCKTRFPTVSISGILMGIYHCGGQA